MELYMVNHYKMNKRKKFFFLTYSIFGIVFVSSLLYYFSDETSPFLYFMLQLIFYLGLFLLTRGFFYPKSGKIFTYNDKIKILSNNEVSRVTLSDVEKIKVEYDLIVRFFTFAEIKLFLDKKYVVIIRGKKKLEEFKKQLEEWYLQKYNIEERTKEGAKLFLLEGKSYVEIQEIKKKYGINWI